MYTKIVTIVFVMGMILNIYGDVKYSLFTIISVFLVGINIIMKFKRPIFMVPHKYFIIMVLFTILRLLRIKDDNFPLGVLLMMFLGGFYISTINRETFLSCYRRVGYILCAVVVIQFVQIQLFGYSFSGLSSVIPLNIGANSDNFEQANWISNISTEGRCNSLFAEPSHFAQFMMPLIIIDLFYSVDKNHMYRTLFWILCVVLSKSGMGFLGLIVIGILYISFYLKNNKTANAITMVLLLSVPCILILPYLFKSEYLAEFVGRIDEFSGDNENISGYIRVVRGFIVYEKMTILQKILGVSGVSLSRVIEHSGLYYSFSKDAGLYFNLIQELLICDGLIVFFAFILFIRELYIYSEYCGKTIITVFVLFSFMESMYFTPVFQLYILSILLLINDNKMSYIKKNQL